MELWIVIKMPADLKMEIQGVATSHSKAMAMCHDEPNTYAVLFEADKDYTDVTEFYVATPQNPEPVLTPNPEVQ